MAPERAVATTTEQEQPATARMLERLTRSHGNDGQHRLHVPGEREPFEAARPLLLVLGAPTFGLAFAISVLTTYGPIVLIRLTNSPSQVGLLIGAEGAFALLVPILAGALSDRLPGSSAARRLPFAVFGAPLVVVGLAVLPLSGGLGLAALAVFVFFVGYYLYYPPYRAIYADLLPRRWYARAQASQAILRGAGLGAALLAGALLLPIWRPLPFAVAAVAVVVTTFALAPLLRLDTRPANGAMPAETASLGRLMLGSGELRTFAIANAFWEFSFSGLKTFIVLYVVHGLGHSTAIASAAIGAVAVSYIVGAPLAGRLADRYGIVRVLRVSALVYGAGLIAGVFPHTLAPLLIGLPFVALAGSIVLTLPQALAFTLAPPGSEGAAAGLQDFSRGIGVVLGPIAVGAAIEVFRPEFSSTHGYAVMWLVIGIPVLASVPLLRTLRTAA